MEVLQAHSDQIRDILDTSLVIDTESILTQPETAPIEIHLNKAVMRITNENLDNTLCIRYHNLAFTHIKGRAMLGSNPSSI